MLAIAASLPEAKPECSAAVSNAVQLVARLRTQPYSMRRPGTVPLQFSCLLASNTRTRIAKRSGEHLLYPTTSRPHPQVRLIHAMPFFAHSPCARILVAWLTSHLQKGDILHCLERPPSADDGTYIANQGDFADVAVIRTAYRWTLPVHGHSHAPCWALFWNLLDQHVQQYTTRHET